MRHVFFCVFSCGMLNAGVFAQALRQPLSALYPASSGYSLYQRDVFGFLANPASLAFVQNFSAGVYGEQRFMLAELGVYHLAADLPMGPGALGVCARYSGFSGYQESGLGIAYARRLGEKAALGIQFNGMHFRVPGIISDVAVAADCGALVRVAPKLMLGLHLHNTAGGLFAHSQERLPSTFKLGMGFDASEKFHVSAELLKDSGMPITFLSGFQYQFQQRLFIRAGINTSVGSGFAGVGLAWAGLRADLTASLHPQLGLTPGFMLISFPGKKSPEKTNSVHP